MGTRLYGSACQTIAQGLAPADCSLFPGSRLVTLSAAILVCGIIALVRIIIILSAICLLIGMSVRANTRFRNEERLPMQWSLDGSVNWTAPRAVALALTPVLAAGSLAATVAMTYFLKPRPGQEGLELPVVLFMATVFVAAHGFHLWMIGKTLKT